MLQNVTVKDKLSNVRAAKIDQHLNAGIGMIRIAIPIRNFDRVFHLADDCWSRRTTVQREIILRLRQKMHLMQMKLVILERPVLDRPLLDGALLRDQRRRIIRAENLWSLVVDGYEELEIGFVLRKINHVRGCWTPVDETGKPLSPGRSGS